MLKINALAAAMLLSLLFVSCSKDDSNSNSITSVSCSDILQLGVNQQKGVFIFSWNGANSEVEIAYTNAKTGTKPEEGKTITLSGTTATNGFMANKNRADLGVNVGENHYFFIRTKCSGGGYTNWSKGANVLIESACESVRDLKLSTDGSGIILTWATYQDKKEYEVEYGPQGFVIGTGKRFKTNVKHGGAFTLEKGKYYDFYVRANCLNNLGWSAWRGLLNQKATQYKNFCKAPSNIKGSKTSLGALVQVNFSFETYGNKQFEYVVVDRNKPPSTGTVKSHTLGVSWPAVQLMNGAKADFYVRAICHDGSKTGWSDRYEVNL